MDIILSRAAEKRELVFPQIRIVPVDVGIVPNVAQARGIA